MTANALPRLLVVDDLFGRILQGGRNPEREDLCARFAWLDASDDAASRASRAVVRHPSAEVVFCRGQRPLTAGVGTTVENDLDAALVRLREGWSQAIFQGGPPWTMVLLDLCFSTGRVTRVSNHRGEGTPEGRPSDDHPSSYFGLVLLDAIHREFPDLPVCIFSSKPRAQVSLAFSRGGALGFVDRSDPSAPKLLEAAIWSHGLFADQQGAILGNSLPLLLALREGRRAAAHGENVLIRGERGTGKELMAQFLHRARSTVCGDDRRPFVPLNSAVFGQELFGSELFGIEAKTATGVDARVGLIESAMGGDLFLDEIADMPGEVQAAVLRVLQDRHITRVGGRRSIAVNVRFLSATNTDLDREDLGFRADLLDRLRQGGTVWVPPLRARGADIPALGDRFLREAEGLGRGTQRHELTDDTKQALLEHEWPGNVRELRSVVFEAVARHPDVEYLVPSHLRLAKPRPTAPGQETPDKPTRSEADDARSMMSSFGGLLRALSQTSFSPHATSEWAGRLEHLQQAQHRLTARLLLAAFEATKRRTAARPNGIVQIHPALKLLTGEPGLTASQAADSIKRLLGPIAQELEGDLREAYETALRLRPKATVRTPRPEPPGKKAGP